MINFRVADLDALLARLRSEGVTVDERTEKSDFGYFGWATDPEGNRIELWEPPEAECWISSGQVVITSRYLHSIAPDSGR